jgi:hypothetical protein
MVAVVLHVNQLRIPLKLLLTGVYDALSHHPQPACCGLLFIDPVRLVPVLRGYLAKINGGGREHSDTPDTSVRTIQEERRER